MLCVVQLCSVRVMAWRMGSWSPCCTSSCTARWCSRRLHGSRFCGDGWWRGGCRRWMHGCCLLVTTHTVWDPGGGEAGAELWTHLRLLGCSAVRSGTCAVVGRLRARPYTAAIVVALVTSWVQRAIRLDWLRVTSDLAGASDSSAYLSGAVSMALALRLVHDCYFTLLYFIHSHTHALTRPQAEFEDRSVPWQCAGSCIHGCDCVGCSVWHVPPIIEGIMPGT
jgi:hypothetical protein